MTNQFSVSPSDDWRAAKHSPAAHWLAINGCNDKLTEAYAACEKKSNRIVCLEGKKHILLGGEEEEEPKPEGARTESMRKRVSEQFERIEKIHGKALEEVQYAKLELKAFLAVTHEDLEELTRVEEELEAVITEKKRVVADIERQIELLYGCLEEGLKWGSSAMIRAFSDRGDTTVSIVFEKMGLSDT
ncbi:hypothetical protein EJ08DRAFT_735927 [Tothia fuscella]|uniref:Uncharacterized protein n=1 Tax=Tothia fuscella TaxID=1048955 RepID=A0A9P4TWW5_9PEZI|nr:hypothetical protein EJ08DRAFT_735927 [Tothia fuscella]